MIGTAGPGRVWGGGSGPPGSPDVTLTSTNTLIEDGNRTGNLATGGSPVGGEQYYFRLSNPMHDPCECGPGNGPVLSVNDGASHAIADWAAQVYAGRLDGDCPTGGIPNVTGYFTVGFTGVFEFVFTANYCNACVVAGDESFVCELWGPL